MFDEFKKTSLTQKFDFKAFKDHYNQRAVPLFLIDKTNSSLSVFTGDQSLSPQPGQTIISFVRKP